MKKKKFSPIFVFIVLTFATILISFVLSLLNVQAEYSTVNTYTNQLQNNVVQVENLLSGSGLKYIVVNAVNNFVNFEPFSILLIILIGIGVLEKTGFLRVFFTLITQNFRKNSITFILILLGIISSLFGNIGFVVLLPLGALLFKYGHRNPLGGIITSFAGITFGYSINLLSSSLDTSLLSLTTNAAHVIDASYTIGLYFELLIMGVALIAGSILMTRVTEKTIMPKLGKYEFEEVETLDKVKLTNRELRGLILSIGAALIYILIIVYMIIPGLPLSGALLDNNATYYVDKLFGANSLFNQGFVFIVTFLFIIVGLVFGFTSKSIKSDKDISESLEYSLDGIGNVIVLTFVASLFVSAFSKSNIGLVIVSWLTNLLNVFNFNGIGLVILLFIISIISGLFYTGTVSKWQMMSATAVPVLMNASVSAEMAQVIYVAGTSISMALTPLMVYYVVYLALLEKYDKNRQISMLKSFGFMKHYALVMLVMWFILLVGFYITGLPLGVGSSSILSF